MLTGRAARATTWRIIDEWIAAHSSAAAEKPTPAPARSRAAQTAAEAAEDRAKKAPAKKASKSAIGANPSRRYGSAGSRTLAAKKK